MRARAKPQARARRTEKTVKAAKLSRAGSKVVRQDQGDGVRRVVQCVGKDCGRTVQYRGDAHLWAAGWGSSWSNAGHAPGEVLVDPVRTWRCPSCWSLPALATATPSYAVDPEMLKVAELGPADEGRKRLEGQIVRLLAADPRRGEIYLKAIVEHLKDRGGAGAIRWRALADLKPLVASEGVRRKRRLLPLAPGAPQPQTRRIAGEVASKVVAVRFTPTELDGLGVLASKSSEGSPGKLLRAYGLSALKGVTITGGGGARYERNPPAPAPKMDHVVPPRHGADRRETEGFVRILIAQMVTQVDVDGLEELAEHLGRALAQARRAAKEAPPAPAVHLDPETRGEIEERILAYLEEGPEREGQMLDDMAGQSEPEERARLLFVMKALVAEGRVMLDGPGRDIPPETWAYYLPPRAEEPPPAELLVPRILEATQGRPRTLLELAKLLNVALLDVEDVVGRLFVEARLKKTHLRGEPARYQSDPAWTGLAPAEQTAPALNKPAPALNDPPCPLTWEDVERLAKPLKIKPHSGANSPENVWGCVGRVRVTRDVSGQVTRKGLRDAQLDSGTHSVDLAIAWLLERGELVRVSGTKVGHPTEHFVRHRQRQNPGAT